MVLNGGAERNVAKESQSSICYQIWKWSTASDVPNFAVGYVSDIWNFKNLVDGPHCMIANHKLGYRMEYISGSIKVPREPRWMGNGSRPVVIFAPCSVMIQIYYTGSSAKTVWEWTKGRGEKVGSSGPISTDVGVLNLRVAESFLLWSSHTIR